MSRARILALAALAAPLVACGDDDPTTGFAQCTADVGIVTLTLSGGAQPVLNWDPDCSVALLLIKEAGVRDLWNISTFREEVVLLDPAKGNLITPPVTYGVVPTGVLRIWGPETLTSGVLQVLLQRILEDGRGWERFGEANCVISDNSVCVIVLHEFTR